MVRPSLKAVALDTPVLTPLRHERIVAGGWLDRLAESGVYFNRNRMANHRCAEELLLRSLVVIEAWFIRIRVAMLRIGCAAAADTGIHAGHDQGQALVACNDSRPNSLGRGLRFH